MFHTYSLNNNVNVNVQMIMLSGFSGIILVITPSDNNSPHKVQETEAKKITATVDVVIPSGSTLTNRHDQICVGDGSDK
jgi:uncharacterized protein (DUF4213/DUF364 family)